MASSAKTTELRTNMHKGFSRFVSMTYGKILRLIYRLSLDLPDTLSALKPPYIILSNHVNTFDPILISVSYPVPIHWVAGDILYRNTVLRFLMRKLVGAGGLFPEGQRTGAGKNLSLFEATLKLVKLLKVPAASCILEGGCQTLPRWSNRRRPGKLTLALKEPLMPKSFSGMDADEIDAMLSSKGKGCTFTTAAQWNSWQHEEEIEKMRGQGVRSGIFSRGEKPPASQSIQSEAIDSLTFNAAFIFGTYLLSLVGTLSAFFTLPWICSRLFVDPQFRRALVILGASTGTMPTGLALLRIIDPESETPVASDYMYASGLTYIFAIPLILSINLPAYSVTKNNPALFWIAFLVSAGYLVFVIISFFIISRKRSIAHRRVSDTDIKKIQKIRRAA